MLLDRDRRVDGRACSVATGVVVLLVMIMGRVRVGVSLGFKAEAT